jgi:hypothetical protein
MAYDDFNRLTSIRYSHLPDDDAWVSPFNAENSDPRRTQQSPHVAFETRVKSQSFAYDWLSDTSPTDDDSHNFLRSVAPNGDQRCCDRKALSAPRSIALEWGKLDAA